MQIICYPEPVLLKKAREVEVFNDSLGELIDSMFEIMYQSHGIGIAAPQVGISLRAFCIDLQSHVAEPMRFECINPIVISSKGRYEFEEGCLSLPGIMGSVARKKRIEIKFFDRKKNQHHLIGEELLAVVIQHELDHLEGRLFVHQMGRLKRSRLLKRYDRLKADSDL